MYKTIKADFDADAFRNRHKAAAERRADKAGRLQEVNDILDEMDNAVRSGEYRDNIAYLFAKFVPAQGKADTVAGEVLRAMMRILYRDWNDGDVFYTGYGKETCGPCAAYVAETIPHLEDSFIDIAEGGLEDDHYTSAITDIADAIVDYLLSNKDLFIKKNTDDCLSWPEDMFDEYAPKYAFDVEVIDDVQKHIDAHDISWEDFREWIENIVECDINCRGAYLNARARDAFVIENLDKDAYELLENDFYRWQARYAYDLDAEYGDPYEIDEYGDEEYDDEEEE